jgi:parallel beta-helix repeat protein
MVDGLLAQSLHSVGPSPRSDGRYLSISRGMTADVRRSSSRSRVNKTRCRIHTYLAVALCIGLLSAGVSAFFWMTEQRPAASVPEWNPTHLLLTTHSPISIEGDLDLAAQAGSEGWPGDGSASSPFVISNYTIGLGSPDYGMRIANITVHFVVRDCVITNCQRDAMLLQNVTNGTVTFISLSAPERAWGMTVSDSSNMIISHNTCTVEPGMGGSGTGLGVFSCSDMIVDRNTCPGGLSLNVVSCTHSVFSNNSVSGRYISLVVDSTSDCDFVNNTCNSGLSAQPVQIDSSPNNVFMENKFNGAVGNTASDYNCFINNTFTAGYYGLTLDTSNYATVSGNRWNCTGFGLAIGLRVLSSQSNDIFNNTFVRCVGAAVVLESSQYNTIWNNTFYHNAGSGDTYDSAHIQASDNNVSNYWNSSAGYGNYWSDWQSPDDVLPYGIVDIPYNITGGGVAKDYYPLSAQDALSRSGRSSQVEQVDHIMSARVVHPLYAGDVPEPRLLVELPGACSFSLREQDYLPRLHAVAHKEGFDFGCRACQELLAKPQLPESLLDPDVLDPS